MSRLDRLRASFADAGCEALLVTRLVNVRYLAGFTGSAGLLFVTPDDALLVTDGRYRDQATDELASAGVDAGVKVGATVAAQREILSTAGRGIERLGLEAHGVTWAQQRAFAADWFPKADLVATEDVVERLRRVKDEGEVARIAEAARIADDALAEVRSMLADEPAERDVAIALDFEMRRRGASGPSFETIVASGPNGAKPHARPGDRRIREGDLVVIDFGATVDGYCSDMTRTICVGEPSAQRARMLDVVAESQRAGTEAVRAGATGRDVDAVCRQVIADAGWGDAFIHGTGHGVGLEIHEAPRLSTASTDTLEAGQVVTVEPGVYLGDEGGVRIEDTVLVLDDGFRRLTNAPKDAMIGAR